jgi:16S rRNA (guanine527-N7)-methyltransferase
MKLREGIAGLGLEIPESGIERLEAYAGLIEKWNRVYNLTAIREREKIVTHHLLDSLSILPHVNAGRMADVGSGAGLPGIPVAIARPDWQVTLIESNQKKAAFLRQAVIELGLGNAAVVAERVESIENSPFDLIVSRAFSEIGEFLLGSRTLCERGGRFAAMKGQYPEKELAQLPEWVEVEAIIPLEVPGLEGERHLVIMKLETD